MVPKVLWESVLATLQDPQHVLSPVQTKIATTVLSMEAHLSSQKGEGHKLHSSRNGTPESGLGCWYVGPSKPTVDESYEGNEELRASDDE